MQSSTTTVQYADVMTNFTLVRGLIYGWFKGFMDEFRVYKRTLTAAEIIQIIKVES